VISFIDGNAFSRRSVDAASRYDGRDFTSSEWALVDESPDGFRLRFIKGEKRPWGPATSSPCNRASRARSTSAWYAAFHLRRRAWKSACNSCRRKSAWSMYWVPMPESRAIFMHSLPAYGKFAGLIIRPGVYRANEKIVVRLPGRSLHRLLGTCLEANEGLEFFSLELTARLRPVAPACRLPAPGLHCTIRALPRTMPWQDITHRTRPAPCSATATPSTPATTPMCSNT
jgi:hypothetical protein